MFVWNTYPRINLAQASVSIPDYIDRKTQAPAIEDADALHVAGRANLNEGGQPEQLQVACRDAVVLLNAPAPAVPGPWFHGRRGEAGRGQVRHSHATALWTSHFGADRDIVGTDIRINGEAHRVVGVLPADFELPRAGDRAARAVLVHAAADVGQRARQRVQLR